MIPTTQWMKEQFDFYNRKYFGGQLPIPRFKVGCPNGEWGHFDLYASYNRTTRKITKRHGNGILSLTSQYSRSEKSILNTLIHEMIHEYIYIVLGIYPRNQHGKEFTEIATRINADGWNITEANDETETDIKGGSGEDFNSILCIINKPNGEDYKCWVCEASENNINDYVGVIKNISAFSGAKFYKCVSSSPLMLHSTPKDFNGVGGMNFNDAIRKLSEHCGSNVKIIGEPIVTV